MLFETIESAYLGFLFESLNILHSIYVNFVQAYMRIWTPPSSDSSQAEQLICYKFIVIY